MSDSNFGHTFQSIVNSNLPVQQKAELLRLILKDTQPVLDTTRIAPGGISPIAPGVPAPVPPPPPTTTHSGPWNAPPPQFFQHHSGMSLCKPGFILLLRNLDFGETADQVTSRFGEYVQLIQGIRVDMGVQRMPSHTPATYVCFAMMGHRDEAGQYVANAFPQLGVLAHSRRLY